MTTVAGNGEKAYTGDGGPATAASLNMPHEIQFDAAGNLYIAERDNHVDPARSTRRPASSRPSRARAAPGFSGDGGPATQAQLRQPHSIAFDPRRRPLLICDIGNHRIRAVDLATGIIETSAAPASGSRRRTARRRRHAAERSAHDRVRRARRSIWRCARATRSIAIDADGRRRFTTWPGPASRATRATAGRPVRRSWAGRRGWPGRAAALYVADTENHVDPPDRLDRPASSRTVLGTGPARRRSGTGSRSVPLSRPHGVLVDAGGVLYVTDSEAHRIRVVAGVA